MYKNEGNEYFKEKDYGRAVAAYSEGLRRRCGDSELDAVLLTNRGAAHFHLGKGLPTSWECGSALQSCFSSPFGVSLLFVLALPYSRVSGLSMRRRLLEP